MPDNRHCGNDLFVAHIRAQTRKTHTTQPSTAQQKIKAHTKSQQRKTRTNKQKHEHTPTHAPSELSYTHIHTYVNLFAYICHDFALLVSTKKKK